MHDQRHKMWHLIRSNKATNYTLFFCSLFHSFSGMDHIAWGARQWNLAVIGFASNTWGIGELSLHLHLTWYIYHHNFHLVLLLMLAISSKEAKLIHIYTFLINHISLDSKCSIPYHCTEIFWPSLCVIWYYINGGLKSTFYVESAWLQCCTVMPGLPTPIVVSTVHTPRFIKEAAEFRFMISFSYWFHMHEIRSW